MNIKKRIRFLFSKKEEPYFSLKRILGFRPLDISIYKLALLHKSVTLRGKNGRPINNERLEYLGDSVLGTIIADILYSRFPDMAEGELTNIRSRIVQRASLDALAIKIGLNRLVTFNKRCSNNFTKVHINGNAFEALMGAIYIDRGYKHCIKFINKLIEEKSIDIENARKTDINHKSKLIEWAQRNRYALEFVTDSQEFIKETNLTKFCVSVIVEGLKIGEGKGYNKREAQQDAAKASLKKIKDKATRQIIEEAASSRKAEQTATENEEPENSTSEQTDI